jgi:hypothetical protein
MPVADTSANKRLVHRLVDEVINGRQFDMLDDIASDRLVPRLRTAFEQLHAVFPDWHQTIVELVEEDDTVVARRVDHPSRTPTPSPDPTTVTRTALRARLFPSRHCALPPTACTTSCTAIRPTHPLG